MGGNPLERIVVHIRKNGKFLLEEMALATWFDDVAPIQSSYFIRGNSWKIIYKCYVCMC